MVIVVLTFVVSECAWKIAVESIEKTKTDPAFVLYVPGVITALGNKIKAVNRESPVAAVDPNRARYEFPAESTPIYALSMGPLNARLSPVNFHAVSDKFVESVPPPVPPPNPVPVLSCTFMVKLQTVVSKATVKVVGIFKIGVPNGFNFIVLIPVVLK